jgi:hypothetical protein
MKIVFCSIVLLLKYLRRFAEMYAFKITRNSLWNGSIDFDILSAAYGSVTQHKIKGEKKSALQAT